MNQVELSIIHPARPEKWTGTVLELLELKHKHVGDEMKMHIALCNSGLSIRVLKHFAYHLITNALENLPCQETYDYNFAISAFSRLGHETEIQGHLNEFCAIYSRAVRTSEAMYHLFAAMGKFVATLDSTKSLPHSFAEEIAKEIRQTGYTSKREQLKYEIGILTALIKEPKQ